MVGKDVSVGKRICKSWTRPVNHLRAESEKGYGADSGSDRAWFVPVEGRPATKSAMGVSILWTLASLHDSPDSLARRCRL